MLDHKIKVLGGGRADSGFVLRGGKRNGASNTKGVIGVVEGGLGGRVPFAPLVFLHEAEGFVLSLRLRHIHHTDSCTWVIKTSNY